MKRKGAVELSLGFIVMVVFAVILLSLAIVWLQGVVRDIGGLTTDLTQQSANKIQEIFGETGENFAVWPSSYSMSAGKGIKLLAGIKNNARDGQAHRFVINMVPSTASNEVCPERDIKTCSVSGGEALRFHGLLDDVRHSGVPDFSGIDAHAVGRDKGPVKRCKGHVHVQRVLLL